MERTDFTWWKNKHCGDKYIESLIDNLDLMTNMQEEIFGPILPIFTFENIDEPINYINSNENPCSYFFGTKNLPYLATSSGGCVKTATAYRQQMPFGGDNSGMGRITTSQLPRFSHQRSIVTSRNWFDLKPKYAV